MKRKFLQDLGLNKEIINKIMSENGRNIEAEKKKTIEFNKEIVNIKKLLNKVSLEVENLNKKI